MSELAATRCVVALVGRQWSLVLTLPLPRPVRAVAVLLPLRRIASLTLHQKRITGAVKFVLPERRHGGLFFHAKDFRPMRTAADVGHGFALSWL